MTEQPILITGATGKSGRRVVNQLRAKGLPVRAAARHSEHFFDWSDANTWDAALEGVRAAYIVQVDGTKLVRPFIERAVGHGVRRIVLASGRGIDNPDYAKDGGGVMEGIVDSETAVRESGLDWTISREGGLPRTPVRGSLPKRSVPANCDSRPATGRPVSSTQRTSPQSWSRP